MLKFKSVVYHLFRNVAGIVIVWQDLPSDDEKLKLGTQLVLGCKKLNVSTLHSIYAVNPLTSLQTGCYTLTAATIQTPTMHVRFGDLT